MGKGQNLKMARLSSMLLALLLITGGAFARPNNPPPAAPETEVAKVPKTDPVTEDRDTGLGEGFEAGPTAADAAEDPEKDVVEEVTTIVPADSGLDPSNATTPNSTITTEPSPPTTSTQNTTSTSTSTSTSSTSPETTTQNSTTSTVTSPTTITPNVTTAVPVNPDAGKSGFDGWSFFGGIVLALVGVAISFLSIKYWKIRRGQTTGGDYNRF